MIYSEQLDQLATALAAAQSEFTAIPKDATNPFFKSLYADLPKVVEVASPILTRHGLSVSQHLGADDTGDTLTTWLLHSSGQFIASTARLHLAKDDAQSQGSATTYLRRYSYMAVLGLVADVDDDGNAATPQSSEPTTYREPPTSERRASPHKPASEKQIGLLKTLGRSLQLSPGDLKVVIDSAVGRETTGWADLSSSEASKAIEHLKSLEPIPPTEEPF